MRHLSVVPEKPLPTAWDGVPIEWDSEAIAVGAIFICPPPKVRSACSKCGTLHAEGADSYVGRMPHTEPAYWYRDEAGRKHKHPERTFNVLRLILTRCLACGHDEVWDDRNEELWDLDESDYGDDGSWVSAPTLPGVDA